MATMRFGLGSLAMIDGGRVRLAFDDAIKRCEDDCIDRPGEKAARTVKLTIELTPRIDPSGALDSVDATCRVTDAVPMRRSRSYNLRVSGQGLLFDELSVADAHQGTLALPGHQPAHIDKEQPA